MSSVSTQTLQNGDPHKDILSNDAWNSFLGNSIKFNESSDILYNLTMDEIASGKASGPFTKSEMDSKFGV
eukprot:674513-Karenia_brevis.AAC.1